MTHRRERFGVDPKILLLIPVIVYIFSYIYLALFHGRAFLFGTVIHESGRYTFLETLFYASHFFGHIPVIATAALAFCGATVGLYGGSTGFEFKRMKTTLWLIMIAFLAASGAVSFLVFGAGDTLQFIMQGKQSEEVIGQGGSWNLHLPSTMLLFLLIPAYVRLGSLPFGRDGEGSRRGMMFFGLSLLLFLGMTLAVNGGCLDILVKSWSDPRYTAHSVRELATFPLIYFPLGLYVWLKARRRNRESAGAVKLRRGDICIIFLAVLFLAGLAYQIIFSLKSGIAGLAQKPGFAGPEGPGILYLLASHYFEHFLDTIFFTLVCALVYNSVRKR